MFKQNIFCLCGLIVRVRVVPRRTVVGEIGRRFDNLSGSHHQSHDVIRVMMTSAQVVETSVNVTNNSPSRDYSHPDDQTTQTTETLGFKPFTVLKYIFSGSVWKGQECKSILRNLSIVLWQV